MSFKDHPVALLEQDQLHVIRGNALVSEQMGVLHDATLSIIYERGWFKMLVPKEYGGSEMSLPDTVRTEEALSWADGSLGWVVTLCAGAGWFGGFLIPEFAVEVFKNDKVCFAGSGAVTGIAEIVEDGYSINGRWLHASGAPHATVFTANCLLTKNGRTIKNAAGEDTVLSFAFAKNEVVIIPEWHAMGMVATASFPYEVKNILVPSNRAFKIDASVLHIDRPLYHYPFLQLAETTLSANISGMAIHFLDLCEELFSVKENKDNTFLIDDAQVFSALQKAKKELAEARMNMYHALDHSWECCVKHKMITPELQHIVSVSSRMLAQTARHAVNELYPFCGLSAADKRAEINRVWRDIHTAGQHRLLVF